jgi:putative SOS response-associated peptidase YedK
MPLVLEPARWSDWLTAEPSERTDLLVPPDEEYLTTVDIRPVGPGVGDVRNDGPQLIKPVPAPPPGGFPATFTDLTLF